MAVRRGPAAASDSDDDELPSAAALEHYEGFRRRLQADLAAAREARDALVEEEAQYGALEENMTMLAKEQMGSLHTLVPLGCGVHAQAVVPDTSTICVHVALGFHPELTLDEARAAAAARRQYLHAQIDARTAGLASILAHLRLVEQALADLAGLQQQQQRERRVGP